MKLILASLILISIITACAPTPQSCESQGYITPDKCPTVTCPDCPEPEEEELLFLYFIDVGQGDASLIKYGDTEMLIDCGTNSRGYVVADFLEEKGVTELDYLLITHPDADHLGGCDDVLRAIKTRTVITNGDKVDTYSYNEVMDEIKLQKEQVGTQVITADIGDEWSIGEATIEVLQANNYVEDKNQNSVVTKLTYKGISVLYTGDCDKECETKLLDKEIEAEILKVPHHGSKFGSSIAFLDKVNPSIAIITTGPNAYGHPADETLARLGQENIQVYRTDMEGHIIITTDGGTFDVK